MARSISSLRTWLRGSSGRVVLSWEVMTSAGRAGSWGPGVTVTNG